MSFRAYVSVIARSMMAVFFRREPAEHDTEEADEVMMLVRNTSAGDSSSRGTGRSKGLM